MRSLFALLAFALLPLAAQDAAAPPYKVEYAIKETGQQVRRYSILIEKGGKGNFRVGTRQAYPSGTAGQFQYADVGVNIDARLNDTGRSLVLETTFNISGMLPARKEDPPNSPPVITQFSSNVTHQVTVGKPVVIAVIDDPVTLRRFEIEATLTATR